jgi:hypothetical protein
MDTSPLIILFGHKARHGKDTVVKTIIDAYKDKYDVRRYAFADELKNEVEGLDKLAMCARYGVAYDFNPPMDDPLCPTGKQSSLLQAHGAHMRTINPYHWVNKLGNKIEKDKPQIALISDMRYKNERLWGLANDGYTVNVTRQGYVDLSRDPNHESEVDLDGMPYDFYISVPEGNLEELRADALDVFEQILKDYQPEIDRELPGAVFQVA